MRIVSLLPSATEILFALGAGGDLVGVTVDCDFPEGARQLRVVSGSTMTKTLSPGEIDAEVRAKMAAGEDLYHLDRGALADLAPDLVVTQDLCAVCAVDISTVEDAMSHLSCSGGLLTIDPATLEEVLGSISELGAATGHGAQAEVLVESLRGRLRTIAGLVARLPRPRLALLEWTDPPFCAGHWVPEMVEAAGATALFGRPGERSGRIGWEALRSSGADIVVVSPCGYHLDGAARLAAELSAGGHLPVSCALWAVDADSHFVRPGPRVVDGVEILAHIAHPELGATRPELARRIDPRVASLD